MDIELHTDILEKAKLNNLNSQIRLARLELINKYANKNIDPLKWGETFVAFPIEVKVELPTRGPIDKLDIREVEPIFLLIDRNLYPYAAPTAWSNRKDFPADLLPHLNPTWKNGPANFCLHRGNMNNWFMEHSVIDLVERIRSWLRDAARGRLIRDQDNFEPTRIESDTGYSIFDSSRIHNSIEQFWKVNEDQSGFIFSWHSLIQDTEEEPLVNKKTYVVRFELAAQRETLAKLIKLSSSINDFHSKYPDNKEIERKLFGIIAIPDKRSIVYEYCSDLPENLVELKEWGKNFGINIEECLNEYMKSGLALFRGIPISVVINRPQKLIGSNCNSELINFIIRLPEDYSAGDDTINDTAKVYVLSHREPLTLERARYISSFDIASNFNKMLFIGCGALGSKIILHFAKSGQANMTLIDDDKLSPHNFVRHGLLGDSVGKNKAEALKEAIKEMFYSDSINVDAFEESAVSIFKYKENKFFDNHAFLIDTTASPVVFELLSTSSKLNNIKICRCELGYSGRLGFLLIEGSNRNPKIDDLQTTLFDAAVDNDSISDWLQSINDDRAGSVGSIFEDIQIGISCSSETMRLADEVVTNHAATFTSAIRKDIGEPSSNIYGKIQINDFSDNGLSHSIICHEIEPFDIIKARITSKWQVRISQKCISGIVEDLRANDPDETGGILIGLIHRGKNIVYVTRFLPAPKDSEKSPYVFKRGIQDIPEEVKNIQKRTGGLIGYVGEWHTHPKGSIAMSKTDKDTAEKIKKNLDKINMPTLIMIFGKKEYAAYIY